MCVNRQTVQLCRFDSLSYVQRSWRCFLSFSSPLQLSWHVTTVCRPVVFRGIPVSLSALLHSAWLVVYPLQRAIHRK